MKKVINNIFLFISLISLGACNSNQISSTANNSSSSSIVQVKTELTLQDGQYIAENGLVFTKSENDKLEVVGYQGENNYITIKDSYDNMEVISIGNNAFAKMENVRNINLPSTLTNIGDSAFVCCGKLTRMIVPKNVENIGRDAFYNCYNLKIFLELTEEPDNWSYWWNVDGCPTYWYSEEEPTSKGDYWHYDENNKVVIWGEEAV